MLSVRVVTVDHYMSKQINELYDDRNVPFVQRHWYEPVIRIFGPTTDGIKTCVHIHGVYPYMYVPYKGENQARDALLLGAALDQALATALNSNATRFVYKVVPVSGIPLYGYHSSPSQFFRIYFLNPYHIKKASDLLLKGVILGEKLQPHEAHIPFILQFMIDYNIYGMSFINLEKVKYRRSTDPGSLKGIDNSLILSSRVRKVTHSYWEVDALAEDIINYRSSSEAASVNPGLEAIWEDERNRRRAQSRPSQITPQISESRPEYKITSNELMHKERLSRKLKDIVVEVPCLTREIPASAEMIDASVVGSAGIELPSEDLLEDVSDLIDEKILAEMVGNRDGESESEGEREREDSILGRNRRDEEEAELEEDDSGDMTQPLEMLENVIGCDYHANREEQGGVSSDSEEQFWKEMADKILQLDGADDLSSMDSDEENRKSIRTVDPQLLNKPEDAVDRILGSNSPSNDSISNWSNNIMSILNENSATQPVCPTAQGFWYNWSPKTNESLWPNQNTSDAWAWDKNDSALLECLSYSVKKTGKVETSPADKNFECQVPNETINSGELYGFPTAQGEYFHGNYTPATTMSPMSNVGSVYNISPPSAILTPSSEMDNYSDVNLDSVSQISNSPSPQDDPKATELCARTQIIETKTVTVPRVEVKKSTLTTDHKDLLDILRNISETNTKSTEKVDSKVKMVALTLKQYIKTCGEIVSVDFKNISGKEMIVVEYKPLNSKSNQNKFLIKPMDKFLEDWYSAEERHNNTRISAERAAGEWPRLINGFSNSEKSVEDEKQLSAILRTLENKYTGNWLNESRIKTIKNKFVVKSMEMLPDNCEGVPGKVIKSDVERSYKVNENVDSNGKIKMKIIKDRKARKLENEEQPPMRKFSSSEPNNFRSVVKRKRSKSELNKVNKLSFLDCGRSQSREKKATEREDDEEGHTTDDDKRLIDQINRSFEDYFKNIVKVNAWSSKNETVIDEEDETTSGEDGNEEHDPESDPEQISAETIKFITQLLSALMSLSRSSTVPSLSVTINFVRGRLFPSLHFNLAPRKNGPQKRKTSKKLIVNSFDGPADDTSSSEESLHEKPTMKTPTKKKVRKDHSYRPLDVVMQKVPVTDVSGRKRKLPSARNLEEDAGTSASPCSSVYYPRSSRSAATPEGRQQENNSGSGSNPKQKIEAEDLTEFGKAPGGGEQLPRFDKALMENELDFIEDSDEESDVGKRKRRRFRRLLRKAKKKKKVESVTVPQTDVVSSSDGESSTCLQKESKGECDGEKGMATFGDKNMTNEAGTEKTALDVALSRNTPEEVDLTEPKRNSRLSQENDGYQIPSESTPLSSGMFNLSLDLNSLSEDCPAAEVAVNSDDSIEKVEPSEPERVVTPFELSGSVLHGENSPINSQSSGISPLEKMLLEVRKSSSGSGSPFPEVVFTLTSSMTIIPKTRPPSFSEVRKTLSVYGIQETIAQVPFYGDPKDITKAVEIGQRVLKIENYSIAGLKSHLSEIDVVGTEERRNRALKFQRKGSRSIRSLLVGKGEICITPLSRPPTRDEVCTWSEEKVDKVELEEKTRAKVRMPKSPGQDSESDDEMDLSMAVTSEKEESICKTPEESCVAGPSGLKRSHSDKSSTPSPCSFPEDLKHSTPIETKSISPDSLGIRKGPLHRIKGVKRLSLLKKLETIAEEQQCPLPEEVERSPKAAGEAKEANKRVSSNSSFGIQGVTLDNTYGFKNSVQCLKDAKVLQTHENVTMLVMELHVQTRGSLRPDPQHDPICALFYTLVTDGAERVEETGVIAVGEKIMDGTATSIATIHHVQDEKALLDKVIEYIRLRDPDILAGYEIEMNSWGYLFQRSLVLEKNTYSLASRVVDENQNWKETSEADGEEGDAPKFLRPLRVTGRIVLDVWRLLRHEVALTSYSFENVMFHILHERHPSHTYRTLSQFWDHPTRLYRHITAEYYSTRTRGIVRLLDHLDFISRNSELARLFGIQFYEVLSRGSQFRVESMMLRLAKPANYVPCSPSITQRAAMRAPASLPLIMEPESSFYADPVIVLDFQSLYPSMIIAYNYCFSTCLGRVELLGGREPFEFGCTHLQIPPEEVKNLEKDLNISPAGIAFVRPNVRKGILPSMLEEILETRLMVKKSMKENKGDKLLQKVLHARQLGLKLIANVTYGYTAANFSGRMPCIEVGDSVVSKGRETLQRAIEMVKNNPMWGAKVVYGDTDSLFVSTPGKSRKEAFEIGNQIAEAVTRDNPKPVKLKLEKVFQPSILQTKKRYVGYMYESHEQEKPVYHAKGIETVRRDGCPATAKILQKALQILFETKDVSQVKKYTIRQFAKLFQGRVNTQDLIFAKEYRGRRGYRPGACVPALELAKRWTQVDKRAEPRNKERVPYVIVNGPPGLPLIRLVRSPRELFLDPSLRINAAYYITKAIIPPMQRCFSLLGADVVSWYAEMPRKYHKTVKWNQGEERRRHTISQYFASVECVVCSEVSNSPLCAGCREDPQKVTVVIHDKIRRLEKSHYDISMICASCCKRNHSTDCDSLDCPVLYRKHQALRDLDQVVALREIFRNYSLGLTQSKIREGSDI